MPGRSSDAFAAQRAATLARLTRYRDEHGTPTLTPERIAQLDAIGFDWGPATVEQQRWANAIAHLSDYVAEHGHTRVPHRVTCSDGFRLGLWVTTRRVDRRHSRQSLTPDRITELDNLGFDWGTTRTKP